MSKLLVVEDVAALRQHIVGLIQTKIAGAHEIHEATNGAEGLKLFRALSPEMIVMDISMPELNGIKAAQQIWAESPKTKILFWSQYHREAYVRELGKIVPDEAIHGYALKSETDEKLAYAITSVLLQDNPYIDPLVRGVQQRLQCKDQSITDVEYETLLDIAIGMTDRAIACRRHISVRGVQNRLSMLLNKLVAGEDAYLRELADMEIYNPRTRVVYEALKRGLLDTDELPALQKDLDDWLSEEYDFERAR
jgi:DNA-binding NarL/FixJ family response regulator